jgi:hypothetical protein
MAPFKSTASTVSEISVQKHGLKLLDGIRPHRNGEVVSDILGNAPDQQVPKTFPGVRAHGDHICLDLPGEMSNSIFRIFHFIFSFSGNISPFDVLCHDRGLPIGMILIIS